MPEYKKCDKCLAYYTGTHQCDGLMKMLVGFAKAKEEKKKQEEDLVYNSADDYRGKS